MNKRQLLFLLFLTPFFMDQSTWAIPVRVRVTSPTGAQRILSVEIEDYLPGVVTQEMNAKEFPQAALEAQAIAARSYAWAKAQAAQAAGRDFDLESTVLDQVYDASGASDPRALAAVRATRGQVLVERASGRVFAPYYHSTCGGMTELPHAVWGRSGGAESKKYRRRACSFCADSPRARWESSISDARLAQLLHLPAGERIVAWILHRKGPELRISSLEARLRSGQALKKTGQQWRAILGFDVLRSLQLDPPRSAQSGWIFRGRGAGHGVGLCQWGARGAAQQGWSAQKILSFYYPFSGIKQFQ